MGCIGSVTLTDITLGCSDIPRGGIKRLLVANSGDVKSLITVDPSTHAVTVGTLTAGTVHEIEFSNKDNFSQFTDSKTATADGITKAEPVINVELPRMDGAKREALNNLVAPLASLIAFVEDSSGSYWMVGYDYGLYGSEVKGNTGTGRDQKNTYQLKLMGEEDDLAYSIDDANWALLLAGLTA